MAAPPLPRRSPDRPGSACSGHQSHSTRAQRPTNGRPRQSFVCTQSMGPSGATTAFIPSPEAGREICMVTNTPRGHQFGAQQQEQMADQDWHGAQITDVETDVDRHLSRLTEFLAHRGSRGSEAGESPRSALPFLPTSTERTQTRAEHHPPAAQSSISAIKLMRRSSTVDQPAHEMRKTSAEPVEAEFSHPNAQAFVTAREAIRRARDSKRRISAQGSHEKRSSRIMVAATSNRACTEVLRQQGNPALLLVAGAPLLAPLPDINMLASTPRPDPRVSARSVPMALHTKVLAGLLQSSPSDSLPIPTRTFKEALPNPAYSYVPSTDHQRMRTSAHLQIGGFGSKRNSLLASKRTSALMKVQATQKTLPRRPWPKYGRKPLRQRLKGSDGAFFSSSLRYWQVVEGPARVADSVSRTQYNPEAKDANTILGEAKQNTMCGGPREPKIHESGNMGKSIVDLAQPLLQPITTWKPKEHGSARTSMLRLSRDQSFLQISPLTVSPQSELSSSPAGLPYDMPTPASASDLSGPPNSGVSAEPAAVQWHGYSAASMDGLGRHAKPIVPPRPTEHGPLTGLEGPLPVIQGPPKIGKGHLRQSSDHSSGSDQSWSNRSMSNRPHRTKNSLTVDTARATARSKPLAPVRQEPAYNEKHAVEGERQNGSAAILVKTPTIVSASRKYRSMHAHFDMLSPKFEPTLDRRRSVKWRIWRAFRRR